MELRTRGNSGKGRQVGYKSKVFPEKYTLSVDNALNKKQAACERPPFAIELKDGGNQTTLVCNTGAYEILKSGIMHYFLETEHQTLTCKHTTARETRGAHTRETIQINDSSSAHGNFTINLYNTSSRLLINGKGHGRFIQHYLPIITKFMQANSNIINQLNDAMKVALEQTKTSKTTKSKRVDTKFSANDSLECVDSPTNVLLHTLPSKTTPYSREEFNFGLHDRRDDTQTSLADKSTAAKVIADTKYNSEHNKPTTTCSIIQDVQMNKKKEKEYETIEQIEPSVRKDGTVTTRELTNTKEQESKNNEEMITSDEKDILKKTNRSGMITRSKTTTNPQNVQESESETSCTSTKKNEHDKIYNSCSLVQDDGGATENIQVSPKIDDDVVALRNKEKSKECEIYTQIEPHVTVLELSACRTKNNTVTSMELADTKEQERGETADTKEQERGDTETVQVSPKEDEVEVVVLMSSEKRKECEENEEIEPSVNVLELSACRTKDDTVITRELVDTKDQDSMNNEEIDTSVGKDEHILKETNGSGMVTWSKTTTNPSNVKELETSCPSSNKSEHNKINVNLSSVQDDWGDTGTIRVPPKVDDVVLLMSKEKEKESEKNEQKEPCLNVLELSACRTKDDILITRKLTDTKEQGSKNNEKFVTSGRKDVLEEFNRSGMVTRSRTITNSPNVQEPETSRTSYKKSELNKTNVNCSLVQDDWDDTETVQGSSKEDGVALLMNKDKRKECEKMSK